MTMHPGAKVIAPLGVATIAARGKDGGWLVCYSRRDYTQDQWRVISPGNGPCVYRMVTEDQIKLIGGNQ